jgi:hypothetical protein
MKLTYTRASALLVLALGLSACGGKATFDVGGPISGLYFTGLKITNTTNGDVVSVEPPAAAAAGVTSFKLATKLEYGQPYNVKITNLPEHQNCTLFNGADTAGRLATINIGVACTVLTFPIGGTVSGLIERDPLTDTTSTRLKITNGSDTLVIEKNTVSPAKYAMPTPVAYNLDYGVAIVSQPTGQTCSIANASGRVLTVVTPGVVVPPATTAPDVVTNLVDNINITCVNNP